LSKVISIDIEHEEAIGMPSERKPSTVQFEYFERVFAQRKKDRFPELRNQETPGRAYPISDSENVVSLLRARIERALRRK